MEFSHKHHKCGSEAGRLVHRETVGEVGAGDDVIPYVVEVVNKRFEGTVYALSFSVALRVVGSRASFNGCSLLINAFVSTSKYS